MNKVTGIVKWYSATKGYGFIRSDALPDQDIFVHFSHIAGNEKQAISGMSYSASEYLKDGERVTFELIRDAKLSKAINVTKENES